uniref:Uncharacterized protein n=1 Tax=Rhizophora mucronata TaxID=61149 RepID=A0A2P2PHU3_RHIMU
MQCSADKIAEFIENNGRTGSQCLL